VTGACLAEAGYDVIYTDIDAARIAQLNNGIVPIYEHHLDKVLVSAGKAGKISYTADAGQAIRASDAIFICIGTPPKENGYSDLLRSTTSPVRLRRRRALQSSLSRKAPFRRAQAWSSGARSLPTLVAAA
jgi:UDP-glucose 6-dehydrogenase